VIITRTLSKLLAAIALLGLLLSPFAPGALAMSMPASDITVSTMTGGAMPCCPDEAPGKNCAKTCPLMAMCANQALPAQLGFTVQVLRTQATKLVALDDAPLNDRADDPPPRPPKLFI
jgi:hypothetical protein